MKIKTNCTVESFEPSYSVIGQCLSNKNESATVVKKPKNLQTKQGLSYSDNETYSIKYTRYRKKTVTRTNSLGPNDTKENLLEAQHGASLELTCGGLEDWNLSHLGS